MIAIDILIMAAILFVVSLFILYSIIRSATKANESSKLLKIQVELLQQLALKNGVEVEKLNQIIDKHK